MYVHTYIRNTYMHTYVHTYIHVRTYMHTYIHTRRWVWVRIALKTMQCVILCMHNWVFSALTCCSKARETMRGGWCYCQAAVLVRRRSEVRWRRGEVSSSPTEYHHHLLVCYSKNLQKTSIAYNSLRLPFPPKCIIQMRTSNHLLEDVSYSQRSWIG